MRKIVIISLPKSCVLEVMETQKGVTLTLAKQVSIIVGMTEFPYFPAKQQPRVFQSLIKTVFPQHLKVIGSRTPADTRICRYSSPVTEPPPQIQVHVPDVLVSRNLKTLVLGEKGLLDLAKMREQDL